MHGPLTGKVAIVTGCGSSGPGWGNGKAIAVRLARAGAKVFGCDIRLESALATKSIIAGEGGICDVAQVDVTKVDEVRPFFNRCITDFGRLDVLVNNVGIVSSAGILDCSEEDWHRTVDINVTSMFLMCKHAIPHMLAHGGSIVNIGSIAGIRDTGVPYIAYSTTKAAILGFSRSIAAEFARKHIRSNVVVPGLMNTPMIVTSLSKAHAKSDVDEMLRTRDQQCPMGHMGSAWDVAEAVLYLASDSAKYVTGTELIVDGGITAGISSKSV